MNPLLSRPGMQLALLATLWLLNACSIAPTGESLSGGGANPEQLTRWQIIGKIAYRSPQSNSSGRLHWKQDEGQFNIGLSGPLGQGAMKISGSKQAALIEIAGQDDYHTSEPELALMEQAGLDIPIGTLMHWVRGMPAPSQISTQQQDDAGRNIKLEQAGWQLQYSKYKAINGFWLPGKIRIRKEDRLLLLVINQWILPGHNAPLR